MRFLVLFLTTLLVQTPVRSPGLSGTVTRQDTGAPLSRATVVLQGEGDRATTHTAVTSADGKFRFDDVTPGKYRLTATRDGYISAESGAARPESCGASVLVEAGRDRSDLSLAMVSTGAIAGRLYDRDGEPVSNVTVQAIKYTYQNGSRVLTSVQTAQTNDLGEYRIFYLPPGRYLVAAALENRGLNVFVDGSTLEFSRAVAVTTTEGGAPPTSPSPPEGTSSLFPAGRVSVNPTVPNPVPRIASIYYPSGMDPRSATPIELRPGESFQGADMIVSRVDVRSIKGNVQSAASREVLPRTTVSLISGFPQPGGSVLRTVSVKADGTFEIRSVFPGTYTLLASANDVSGRMTGRVPVDVFSTDVQNVQIAISKGFTLSGHVTSDDAATAARLTGVSLVAVGEDRSIQNMLSLTSKVTNGTFSIDAIPPGTYQAWISFSAPGSIYVKSMRLGSSDVRNGFRIDAQPNTSLEIVAGSRGSMVDGVLVNDLGQPVRGATVVLVPEASLRQRSSSFKSATSDSAGAFAISSIGPGDYKLFAWESVEAGAWEDADFLRAFEVRGQSMSFLEGSRQTVQLTAIPSTGPVYAQCSPNLGVR